MSVPVRILVKIFYCFSHANARERTKTYLQVTTAHKFKQVFRKKKKRTCSPFTRGYVNLWPGARHSVPKSKGEPIPYHSSCPSFSKKKHPSLQTAEGVGEKECPRLAHPTCCFFTRCGIQTKFQPVFFQPWHKTTLGINHINPRIN